MLRYLFTITSGVKQGCPLSPLLFVIAIDPFLRAMEKTISPRSLVCGYADDIALVLENPWKEVAAVADLFRILERTSGLTLKQMKCVMIPLWSAWQRGTLTKLVKEEVPSWANFVIDSKGKYLGVWLGLGAAKLSWEKPLKKYASQCKYIAALKLGVAASALLYRVLALSALSFVVQICPIPEEARVYKNAGVFDYWSLDRGTGFPSQLYITWTFSLVCQRTFPRLQFGDWQLNLEWPSLTWTIAGSTNL